MLRTLYGMAKPTIARVHGAAFGRRRRVSSPAATSPIAAQDATFSLSEAKLGLDSGDDRPVRDRGHRRAAGAALLPHGRALRPRRRRSGSASSTTSCRQRSSTPRINELLGALLVAGPRAQLECKALIRGVAHRPIDDDVIAGTAAAHRRGPRVAGSARKASLRSSASAPAPRGSPDDDCAEP